MSPFVTDVHSLDPVLRRRQLLRGGFWAGAAVLLAAGVASLADFFSPLQPERRRDVSKVASDKVPRPGSVPYLDADGKFWLVNLKPGEGIPEPFTSSPVVQRSGAEPSHRGGLLALSQKCSFNGCTLPWRPDTDFGGVIGWFRCPCCGSVFTKAGIPVFGPASRPLDTFSIAQVTQGGVFVTRRPQRGAPDDPQRAVPAGPFS